jgi:hypothetical protein
LRPRQTYEWCEKIGSFLESCVREHIKSTAIALYSWIKFTVAKVYRDCEEDLLYALLETQMLAEQIQIG